MRLFRIVVLTILVSTLIGCSASTTNQAINKDTNIQQRYITVKYRNTPVDIEIFETLDTSKSSFIRGARYDEPNQYMIINLKGVNYHYCILPSNIWQEFTSADSFGTYYNSYIKGNYDCRNGGIPNY